MQHRYNKEVVALKPPRNQVTQGLKCPEIQ
jgi:hypothetical protein